MTFKEFSDWCNQRAADGKWGMYEATICVNIVEDINELRFWKREKKWQEYNDEIVSKIVNPTNKLIEEYNNEHGIKRSNN